MGIALLIFFAFGASFTQRVTGFGFGIFIMSLLPHIMPSYGEATALSGVLAMISMFITASRFRRFIDWKKLIPILVVFLVISFLCVKIVARVDSKILKKFLGGMLILISIYFFKFSGKIKLKPTIGSQFGLGFLSGVMGGLFAMQGPPAVLFFLSSSQTKEEYMALISAFLLSGNICMSGFRWSEGFFTQTVGWYCLIALPAVLLGLFVGGKVYSNLPIQTIRKVAYSYLALAGLISLAF